MGVNICSDYIRLRGKTDDSKQSGLSVSLYQSALKVADLTQDAGINWQYNFPIQITNGLYDVYINDVPVMNNGENMTIKVYRNGEITLGKDW